MTEKGFKQIFPLGEKNDAYAQYFVGQSYLSMLTTERVVIENVTFEPGCRNNWHIHHKGGQILLCTAGRGYYQEWGKTAQEMKPGDVINIASPSSDTPEYPFSLVLHRPQNSDVPPVCLPTYTVNTLPDDALSVTFSASFHISHNAVLHLY